MRFAMRLAVLLWLLPGVGLAQMTVMADDLKPKRDADPSFWGYQVLKLTGWVYHEGDDPAWASPDFDDRHWATLPPLTQAYGYVNMPDGMSWAGTGWFRLHLEFDASVLHRDLALLLYHSGALDVFLNGKRLFSHGRVGQNGRGEVPETVLPDLPFLFLLPPLTESKCVLAVRYSNFRAMDYHFLGLPTWWGLGLADYIDAHQQRDRHVRDQTLLQLLAGVSLTFALVHFLMYLFRAKLRGSLSYVAFATCISLLIFIPIEVIFRPTILVILLGVGKTILILTVLFGLKFSYTAFFGGLPRNWRAVSISSGILCLGAWAMPVPIVFLIGLIGFCELLRICLIAIWKKKPGARIIGAGIGVFILAWAYQLLTELGVLPRDISFVYIYGFLGLVASMSAFLAYTFDRTNRQIKKQTVEIRNLTRRAVAQQTRGAEQKRRSREAERERERAEEEWKILERELEIANKRQRMAEKLKAANQRLEERQMQLVQTEKMAALGNLVAGIAHEINTPVGAINSMHDTLKRAVANLEGEMAPYLADDRDKNRGRMHMTLKRVVALFKEDVTPDDDGDKNRNVIRASLQEIGEANRVITASTERVRELVLSLRNFARLDEAEWKQVDIHEGIESTLALVRHKLEDRIALVRDYGQLPQVTCFPGRLNQIFLNLLVNAVQAIEGTGRITIQTRAENGEVSVAIADTGKGIAKEVLPKIFDLEFTTKSDGKGALGLSMCRQIAEEHNGRVLVESEIGKGTTVTVVLPIDQPTQAQMD